MLAWIRWELSRFPTRRAASSPSSRCKGMTYPPRNRPGKKSPTCSGLRLRVTSSSARSRSAQRGAIMAMQTAFLTYRLTIGLSTMEGRGFYYPCDTVLGQGHCLYVLIRSLEGVDRGIRVTMCDLDSEYYGTFGSYGEGDGQFVWPSCGAVDVQGHIYVTDEYLHRVSTFDASGTFLATWGTHGSGAGALDGPSGIACDGQGNLFVSEIGRASCRERV